MLARTAFLIILCMLVAPAAWAAAIVIVTPEQTVNGPVLTLGEIAQITGENEAKVSALKALRLGAAPKPGGRLVLTRELLGARLAASGADLTGITWSVPENIVIAANSQVVAGQKMADTAFAALVKRLNSAEDKRQIELVSFSDDVAAPVGEIRLNAEFPYGIRKSGPTVVNVIITCDGRIYDKVSLRYNVKVLEDIVIASKPIAPNELLTAENLTYQRTDVARLPSAYLTDISKLAGLSAKRPIAAGTLVTDSLLKKPILVKRGTNVAISAHSGAIAITASGQALQDGAEGQVIRVQNTNSKRIVTAKVMGEGLVQIITIK